MAQPSEFASEIFGRLRGLAKQVVEGYGGIFKRLATEHGEVNAMMARIAASSEDADVRKELFPKMRKELLAHAKGEELEFYPLFRDHEETRGLVETAYDEHKQIETMLEDLAAADPSDPLWKDNFEQMMKLVQTHVDQEENEIFAKAKDLMTKEEAQEIEERYLREKEKELARLESLH